MDLFNNTSVAFARMSNYELRRAFILFKSLQVPVLFKVVKNRIAQKYPVRCQKITSHVSNI